MNAILEILLKEYPHSILENKCNGWYIKCYISKEKMDKNIGFGIGYNNAKDTYYHNQIAGFDLNSVWNYSRESNDLGIGWYSFTHAEILATLEEKIICPF